MAVSLAEIHAENQMKTAAGFFKLKETCVNPETQKPYILSIKGGRDNSPEGLQVRDHPDTDAQSLVDWRRTALRMPLWSSLPARRTGTTTSAKIPPTRLSPRALPRRLAPSWSRTLRTPSSEEWGLKFLGVMSRRQSVVLRTNDNHIASLETAIDSVHVPCARYLSSSTDPAQSRSQSVAFLPLDRTICDWTDIGEGNMAIVTDNVRWWSEQP